MGRSSSCFKLITCSGDSTNKDDDHDHHLLPSQSKSSNGKCGWSFRRKSGRPQVISNTVAADVPYSANKGASESASRNFQPPPDDSLEKVSVIQSVDEKPQLPIADQKGSETIILTKDESEVHAQREETVVIVIQAAVRGFLARRELFKLQNLVKVQAAVRGHLVRQHAVGTLRCVQAIAKMQALVRARHANLSSMENKIDENHENTISKTLGGESSITKPNASHSSIEKLLGNKFACQLMESVPKKRTIHIKCDPAKQDSAWNWLERWMSVSSAGPTQQTEMANEHVEIEREDNLASRIEPVAPSAGSYELKDSKSNSEETPVPSETKENPITNDTGNIKLPEGHLTSAGDQLKKPHSERKSDAKDDQMDVKLDAPIDTDCLPGQSTKADINPEVQISPISHQADMEDEQTNHLEKPHTDKKFDAKDSSPDIDSFPGQTMESHTNYQVDANIEPPVDTNSLQGQSTKLDINSELQIAALSRQAEMEDEETNQLDQPAKGNTSEQLEIEGKKFGNRSGDASYPAFTAAHSEFEESLSTNSNKSRSSSNHDNMNTDSSGSNAVTAMTKGLNTAEYADLNNLRNEHGGSQSGNEFSITSIDFPGRSEVIAADNERKAKSLEDETCNPVSRKDVDIEDSVVNNSRNEHGDLQWGTELSVTSIGSPHTLEVRAADNDHETKSLENEICSPGSNKDVDVEATNGTSDLLPHMSNTGVIEPENLDSSRWEQGDSVVVADSPNIELDPAGSSSRVQEEHESEKGPAYKSSPEVSPRSHVIVAESKGTPSSQLSPVTIAESKGTPSSQLSGKAKSRTDNSDSGEKRKSLSAGKRSSNLNVDSSARNSFNRSPKDHKKRDCIGSTTPEQTDSEQRNSSSGSPLPHFMQPTESAKAKMQANRSPRLSPDVQDRDYIKKRHSLPAATARQVSPHVKRSLSQAQSDSKGRANHVNHEKKWQR